MAFFKQIYWWCEDSYGKKLIAYTYHAPPLNEVNQSVIDDFVNGGIIELSSGSNKWSFVPPFRRGPAVKDIGVDIKYCGIKEKININNLFPLTVTNAHYIDDTGYVKVYDKSHVNKILRGR